MAFGIRAETSCASKKPGSISIYQKAQGYTTSWRSVMAYKGFGMSISMGLLLA